MGDKVSKYRCGIANPKQATFWDREKEDQRENLEGCGEPFAKDENEFVQSSNGLGIEVRNSCSQLELQKLSPSQCVVLSLYRQGNGPTEIARKLGLAVGSVEEKLTRIRNRLGKTHCKQLLEGYRTQEQRCEITQAQLLRLLEQQEYKCALTGVDLSPENSALDHKKPRVNGGTNTIDNVWFVLDKINKMKGSLEADEFVQLCKLVAKKFSF